MNNSIFLYISKDIQIYISSNPHQFTKKKKKRRRRKGSLIFTMSCTLSLFLNISESFFHFSMQKHLYPFFTAVLYSTACPYHDFFNQSPTGEHSAYFNMFAIIHKGISFKTFKNINRWIERTAYNNFCLYNHCIL